MRGCWRMRMQVEGISEPGGPLGPGHRCGGNACLQYFNTKTTAVELQSNGAVLQWTVVLPLHYHCISTLKCSTGTAVLLSVDNCTILSGY